MNANNLIGNTEIDQNRGFCSLYCLRSLENWNGRQGMEKQKPRQHNLDNFVKWSQKIVKENQQKGGCKNEKKEIKETADLLRSKFQGMDWI